MAGSTLARLVSGALLLLAVARILGPEQFGHLVLNMSLAMAMATAVEYGQSTYIMRELGRAEEPVNQLLARTIGAKLMLAGLYGCLTLLVYVSGVISPRDLAGYACLCLMAVAVTFADFFNACFRGVDRFALETRNVVVASAFHVLLILPVAVYSRDWIAIAAAFLVSRIVYLALSIRTFKLHFPDVAMLAGISRAHCRHSVRQLAETSPFAADSALVTARSYADVFLISGALGTTALGLYQAGMNVVRAIENLGPVIANVFLPKLSGLLKDPQAFARREAQLLYLMLVCGAAGLMAFALPPASFWMAVFGERFEPAFVLFPFFGLYLLCRFVAMALGVLLTAHGQQLGRAIAGMVSLGVLSSVAWVLMPVLGLNAVAAANVASALVLVAWFAVRLYRDRLRARDLISSLLVIGVALSVLWLLSGRKI